jgi:hypothetical protein
MDSFNKFTSNIKKDLNIISYKIDNTIPDGYMSIAYLTTLLFIFIICLYNKPFWSYVLLILLILIFLTIYTNRDFTKVNIMKIILNFTIKPICLFFLIIEKSGITNVFQKILPEKLLTGILFLMIFAFICFVIYQLFVNKIRCKYDLNKIKEKNIDKWNGINNIDNINIDKDKNECTKLTLDKCYSLEELQPCLQQLSDEKNCSYCLDYSYHDNEDSKDNSLIDDKDKCNKEPNYFWNDDICKKRLNTSQRFCIDYTHKDDYNKENIICNSENYCSKELDVKYCNQFPGFDSYKSVYVILYIIALIVVYFYYKLDCISDKAFVLIILVVNILCLILFIFLQNIAVSDEKEIASGSTDSVEYS